MKGATSQRSRRRITTQLFKCPTPRLYVSQSSHTPTTHVQIHNGQACPWSTLYASTKCSLEYALIDYTIKVYNRNNQLTYNSSGTVYAYDPSEFYFLELTQLSLVNGGKIRFTAKARKDGYIDSDTLVVTIYNIKQKLVLNITPVSGTTFSGAAGTCYMDTGDITDDVEIRYYKNVSSLQMPDSPPAPTSTSGLVYSGNGVTIGSNGSNNTYHAITAKAFSLNSDYYEDSDPVSVQYTHTATAPDPPTITPTGGDFNLPVQVTITHPDSWCDIRYTVDGTDPTWNSQLYTGPFTVSETTTVKAVAQYIGTHIISSVASKTYNILISQGLAIEDPTGVNTNSAVFWGYYIGPYNIVESMTGFRFRKDGETNWHQVGTRDGLHQITSPGTGWRFSGSNGGTPLEGNTIYYVKAFTTTETGTYFETPEKEFRTSDASQYIFSISETEQVEFGKTNLTYFRFYSYPGTDWPAYINDAKQYGRCGNREVLMDPWDYIGDKNYTIQTRISRFKDGDTGAGPYQVIDYTAHVNNTTAGTLGSFASHAEAGYNSVLRAASTGGEVVRDLFSWGTSGNGDTSCSPHATCYYPFATSTNNSDYNPYNSTTTDLMVGGDNGKLWADWSQAISYKSSQPDPIDGFFESHVQWDGGTRVSVNTRVFPGACKAQGHDYYTTRSSKTPSKEEWQYLLMTRTTTSGKRFAKGRIQTGTNQYVNGLIIFGDTFTVPSSITNANSTSAAYTSNTITVDDWNAFYDFGAFFLPAAGVRNGTTVSDSNSRGYYWSRSKGDSGNTAWSLYFDSSTLGMTTSYRMYGCSVRLCGPPNIQQGRSGYNVTVNHRGMGNTTGGGYFTQNQSCTVTATPDLGWEFIGWKENGTTVSSNSTYTFTVSASRDLEAWFKQIDYTITVNQNPSNSGTIVGAGTYHLGNTVTLTATPKPGKSFTGWTESGSTVCTTPTYIFNCTSNRTLTAVFETAQLPVTVTTNPLGGATITGAGDYNSGATCTLTAAPADGFTFTKWTSEGSQLSTSNPYSFTVSDPMDIVAELSVKKYNVTTAVTPSGAGTATGGQSNIRHGDNITLTATPGSTYSFVGWSKGSSAATVSNDNPWTFAVTETAQYTAKFSKQSRTISASVSPSGSGTVSGAGNYNVGATCTLAASAANGYSFVRWTENGTQVSTSASYSFTVSVSRTLVANFSQNTYTISTVAGTGGTTSGGGSNFHYGDSCTITATPSTGYTFVKWNESSSDTSTDITTNPYTFSVTRSAEYTATFSARTYNITTSASPSGGGTTSGGGAKTYNTTCTVVATANTGYHFVNWTENGTQVSTSASYSFTVTGARTLVANFAQNTYTVSASASPAAGGTITGTGTYNHGASCTVTATPASGYTFTNWTKGGSVVSTSASYTFTVTSATTLVANFTAVSNYNIRTSASPDAGGSVSGDGTYAYGSSCTVTATPAPGFRFTIWTENGTQVSTSASYTFTVTGDRALVAMFKAEVYSISTTPSPSAGGRTSGDGTYAYGDSCTVGCRAKRGYTFSRWTEEGITVSTSATYTFTVKGNRDLTAMFIGGAQAQCTVSVSANPSDGGRVSGGGTYTTGQTCTVVAKPESGYTFIGWTENGTQVSTSVTYKFTVNSNRTLVAEFATEYIPATAKIKVAAIPEIGGTVTGDGEYTIGDTCAVTVLPEKGFKFVNWTEGGVEVSTDTKYIFVVKCDRALVANLSLSSSGGKT